MKRGTLINLLKLGAVAALLWWVISTNIRWQDAHIVKVVGGQTTTVDGKIEGDWDRPEIVFLPAGATAPITVRPGKDAAGTEVKIEPSFPTFVRNIDWLWFVLGALCYFISASFSAIRWWWLLRVNQLQVTPFEAWRFTWIGVLFNSVVPGQTGGDVIKAVYIIKHCRGGNRVAAGVSVLVDRILGLGSLALLAAIVVLFALDRFSELALVIWAVLAAVALLGVVAFSRRIRRLIGLDALLKALPLSGLLKKIDQAVYFYRGHTFGILVWVVVGTLSHVLSVLSVALIGYAMSLGMPMLEYFVIVPIVNIISAVPLGPNGWGVGELAFGHFFATYGAGFITASDPALVMRTRGVALSLVYRIHLTLWSLLGGVLVLFEKDRVTARDVDDLASEPTPAP
jgi:uncharacterized protein (TIRG00374 family)